MLVRHFSGLEWSSKRDWAVWIAANPRAPAGPWRLFAGTGILIWI